MNGHAIHPTLNNPPPKMSPLERFSKWLQLKIYQFEVTFAVYIFTPVEKFIVYSVLFLLISLTTIAIVLYLPQHVQFIISRAWFYMHGDTGDFADAAKEALMVGDAGHSTLAHGAMKTAEAMTRAAREL